MLSFISSFFSSARNVFRGSEAPSLFAFLTAQAILVVLVAFFSPWIFTALASCVFLVLAAVSIKKTGELVTAKIAEQLEKKEFFSLVNYLPDGVILYDPSFKILTFNRAAEELFKVSSNEVVGRVMEPGSVKNSRMRALTQSLFPSLAPSMSQISGAGTWPQIVDVTTESPSLELRTTLHRIVNEQDEAVAFLRIIKDRTRETKLLAEKSDFIAVAAHQLRTPLTAMGWAMETLTKRTEKSAEDIRSLVAETSAIAQRALKITNDLLDASKIEEGKFGFVYVETDIVALVSQLLAASAPIAKQYSVTLYMEPTADAPLPVRIDTSRISSVLLNILDNAIKYNVKNGKVIVTVQKLPDSRYVKITVEDTGIGIPPADMENIFKKLYRASNAADVEPNGSGLGLYIVKNIVEQHGGTVGFSSVFNRGSMFWFTLPLKTDLSAEKTA